MSKNIIIRGFPDGNVLVSGNTFNIKEELKSKGAQWVPSSKSWKFSSADLDEIRSLVEQISEDEIIVKGIRVTNNGQQERHLVIKSKKTPVEKKSSKRRKKSDDESTMSFVFVDETLPKKKKK